MTSPSGRPPILVKTKAPIWHSGKKMPLQRNWLKTQGGNFLKMITSIPLPIRAGSGLGPSHGTPPRPSSLTGRLQQKPQTGREQYCPVQPPRRLPPARPQLKREAGAQLPRKGRNKDCPCFLTWQKTVTIRPCNKKR